MRAMKDSGIEWIGEIPEGWNTPPLRSRYSFGKGLSITKADLSDDGACVISYGQIHSKENIGVSIRDALIRHIPSNHNCIVDTAKAHIGDLIFADTSEDSQGCGNCVFVDRDDPIYAGYHTLILRPKQRNQGRYYAYLFAADAWRAQVRARVAGVKLYSITQDILKNAVLLEPPSDEQERIVTYLDTKCTEIDALIAAKEKTNALLKERRQSIIYEAVTKGLDPTVPMKDSGIEWIGMIPEGWNIAALKRLGTPSTGSTPSKDHPEYWDGSIPWLSSKDLKADYLCDSEDHVTEEAVEKCGLTVYDANTLVFCVRSGILRHSFPVTIAKMPTTINQDLRALTLSDNAFPDFVLYYLKGMNDTIVTLYQKIGATVESIEMEWFNYLPVVLPPLEEQKAIALHLTETCSSIDSIITANEKNIEKLKEYRQSVIYEAVTGKIEVGNAVY